MPTGGRRYRPLGSRGRHALADALGDTPETVISVHLLRRGLCRAYVAGDPERFDGAVVQPSELPGEPNVFGEDADVIWELLRSVDGWTHPNVSQTCAPKLGSVIEEKTGGRVHYYGDVYHTMTRPASIYDDQAVRRLAPDDLPLVEAAPAEIQGGGFESLETMLAEGIVAGAVLSGGLVAIAHTSAITDRHADIGVSTLEPWRGRGLATAAASAVAHGIQETGRTPVWSAGEGNEASLRVAAKASFRETSRRVYINTKYIPRTPD